MKSLDRHQKAFEIARDWSLPVLRSVVPLAQGYPIELRTLGTLQTIAFSIGKDDQAHGAVARAIASWVLSDKSGAPLGTPKDTSPPALLERLAGADREAYLAADAEAIAFADALKTVSKALFKATPTGAPASPPATPGATPDNKLSAKQGGKGKR